MLITEWNWDDAKEVWQDEAREEGLQMGREEGLQKGRDLGRTEGSLQIAQKMKANGRSPEQIVEDTGLPLETIEKL